MVPEASQPRVEDLTVPPGPWLYIATTCSNRTSTIASEVKQAAQTLDEFMQGWGIAPRGPLLVAYSEWDGRLVELECGYTVKAADATKAQGRILAGHAPSGRALHMVHHGPYATISDSYRALHAIAATRGLRLSGHRWEVFRSPPSAGDAETELYLQLVGDPAAEPPGMAP